MSLLVGGRARTPVRSLRSRRSGPLRLPSAPSRRPVGRTLAVAADWPLLVAVAGLCVIGTLAVWSATRGRTTLTHGNPDAYLVKQLVNIAIGVVLAVIASALNHRTLRLVTPLVYLGSVVGLGLVLVPGVGAVVNGSRSWIHLPGISLQPSEFAKLAVIVGMALLIAERTEVERRPTARITDVGVALLVAAVPVALVVLQPDMGTVMVLAALIFGVVAVSGVPKRWLLVGLAIAVVGVVLVIKLHVLKDYQLARFTSFTDPNADLKGAGYNVHQARIAVGNGGLWGQGLFHGSQTQNQFVPEQQTDFVFTVVGEELGLVGGGAVIALFAVVLWRAVRIARRAPDAFGRLVAVGLACWFGFQAFENIGMTLGLTPVTGLPLPFVSYGGSSMFACLVGIGLLCHIHRRTALTHE